MATLATPNYEAKVEQWRNAPEDDQWAKGKLAVYEQAQQREQENGWFDYQKVLKGRNISFESFAVKDPNVLWDEQIRGAGFNDFADLFHRTLREEFFTSAQREAPNQTLKSLQCDLDVYLGFYNNERPHAGYPNEGQTPLQRLQSFLASSAA